MKKIKLTKGKFAMVDDEDYPELAKHKWCVFRVRNGTYYAARKERHGKSIKQIYIHRHIMKAKPDQQIDHKDHNGLNNQRSNLRFATNQQNAANQQIRTNNTSGYKGVSWHQRDRKWMAQIYFNGKRYFLGYFNTSEEASDAYNTAAIDLNGQFACLNP